MFRTTEYDNLDKDNCWFIFELVTYLNKGGKTEEYACGWGHAPISFGERSDTITIDIHTGTPTDCADLHDEKDKNKSVLNNLQANFKNISSNVKASLVISFKP
jgi:hypothetical protein